MRQKQIYKVIPGVTIKIDGEYCHPECNYNEPDEEWCGLFRATSGELILKLDNGQKDIRCLRCRRYTSAQEEA